MHIGINTLAAHRAKTGIGTYISSLVAGLLEGGAAHRYTLFVSHENAGLFPDSFANCRKVFAPPAIDATPLRVLWEHTALPAWIRRSGIDLFHGPTFVTPLLSRVPSVVTIHDMTWFTHPGEHVRVKRRYFQALIPVAARRAVRIIADSEATRRDILRILDVPGEKVVTVHCGIDGMFRPVEDPALLAAVKQRHGIPGPFVLFVGMIEPRKNLVRLIEAFGRLKSEGFPQSLVLGGTRGWGYEDAAAAVRRLGIERHVVFPGRIADSDLPLLFAAADLFVYPSLYEGFGFPLVEAMACGAPAVTSNVSSLPEIAGEAALLVDPLDVGDLTEAMRRVLADTSLRLLMRARGLERARRFTWKATASATLRVYEEAHAIARARASRAR